MSVEVTPGGLNTTVELFAEADTATYVEVTEGTSTVVEVYDETSATTVEVQSAAVGLRGPAGLSFIVVAPGEDPPPDTPDRTFVFEGPLPI